MDVLVTAFSYLNIKSQTCFMIGATSFEVSMKLSTCFIGVEELNPYTVLVGDGLTYYCLLENLL